MNRSDSSFWMPLLVFLALSAMEAAAQQDCNGYMVTGDKEIDSNIFWAFANKDSVPAPAIRIEFWIVTGLVPDSCDITKRNCPDSVMTRTKKLYERWQQRLLNDYALFKRPDFTERITAPDPKFWPEVFAPLFAPESTIIALSKECYVWRIGIWTVPVSAVPSPANKIRHGGRGTNYNVNGRHHSKGKTPGATSLTPVFRR